jgi:hypothetical protein
MWRRSSFHLALFRYLCRRVSNWGPVPVAPEFRYAVVNDCRVIVEPRTRKIIKIID